MTSAPLALSVGLVAGLTVVAILGGSRRRSRPALARVRRWLAGRIDPALPAAPTIRAVQDARSSEDRCALAVEAGHMGTMSMDLTTRMIETSQLFASLHGRPETMTRLSLEESLREVHPDDRQVIIEGVEAALRDRAPNRIMYRVVLADGQIRWIELVGQVYTDEAGQPILVRGVGFDVTERQSAHEELAHGKAILRRLIDVQEKERQTLCHELHDGMMQYAIAAKMLLDAVASDATATMKDERVATAMDCLGRGIEEGRQVIRGVRSAVLDDLGLTAAIEDLADQLSSLGITVELMLDDEINELPSALRTVVYRVVQESLANARKHAETDRASVEIRRPPGEVQVRVIDAGKGFDVPQGRKRGFGLVGMFERARLAGGDCTIESRPGAGTRVDMRLPIDAAAEGAPASNPRRGASMPISTLPRSAWSLVIGCALAAPLAARAAPVEAPKPEAVTLPSGVRMERDLAYVPGADDSQRLDLYLPEQPPERPLPLVVHIHGGGWRGGSKFPCPTVNMVALGYAVASVEYRFSQKSLFPAQIQDCQAAIRWLRSKSGTYGIDPARVGVVGASAGGHLSALVGTAGGKQAFPAIGDCTDESDRVQAVCDIFGPTNFSTVMKQAADDTNVRNIFTFNTPSDPYSCLIGAALDGNRKLTDAVSPIHYVSEESPPTLILHGTHDALVPYAQSVEFAAALESHGVPVWLQTLPGSGHGGPAFGKPAVIKLMIRFFGRFLKDDDEDIALVPESDLAIDPPKQAESGTRSR